MTDDNTVLPTSGNLVIIGNGMVGHHLVKTLVEQGDASPWTIHVFAGENRPAYDRVHLSALRDTDFEQRSIAVDDHCFGCTAGQGSSCGGALS